MGEHLSYLCGGTGRIDLLYLSILQSADRKSQEVDLGLIGVIHAAIQPNEIDKDLIKFVSEQVRLLVRARVSLVFWIPQSALIERHTRSLWPSI